MDKTTIENSNYIWEIRTCLDTVNNYLIIIEQCLREINLKIKLFSDNLNNNLIYYDWGQTSALGISVSLYLRYCIEIMVSIFISNNRDILDKYNSKDEKLYISSTSNKIINIIRKLNRNKDIDVNVYSISYRNGLFIKLNRSSFWVGEKLIKKYKMLSNYIHFFHYRHEFPLRKEFNFSNSNDVKKYYRWQIKNFKEDTKKLNNIYKSVSGSLNKFCMLIEKNKILLQASNFKNIEVIENPIIFLDI